MFESSLLNFRWSSGLSALLLFTLALLPACDDDGVGPDPNPVLRGQVVGPDGGPLPEIVISPRYFFDPPVTKALKPMGFLTARADGKRLSTMIHFALAEPGSVTVTVENALGETTRTLFAGELDAGDHEVVWSGDRDDGTLVPSGLYTFVLEQVTSAGGNPFVVRQELFLLDVDVSSLAKRPLAVTDADGRFSVPMGLIPVGYEATGTDEQGMPTSHRVLPQFRLHAFRLEGETIVGQSATEVEVLDPSRSQTVLLTMP